MSFRMKHATLTANLIDINYFVNFTVSDASIQLSYPHDTWKGIFQKTRILQNTMKILQLQG